MVVSEKEKFELLLNIIKQDCFVTCFKKTGDRRYIDASCYHMENKIFLNMPAEMNEEEWSEAGSVLLHEYGHCIALEPKETKAWRNAERWVDRNFPQLKPIRFNEIKKQDLEIYKNYKNSNSIKTGNLAFSY